MHRRYAQRVTDAAERPPHAAADWHVSREIAVPRLLALHGDRLYGLARRLCGTPEQAQDVVQETFVQAWRAWDQFAGRSDPIVWLYTIARHACQRLHRPRSGAPQQLASLDEPGPFGEPLVAVVPGGDDTMDEVLRRERIDAVGAAITELPDEFRLPLILKDVVGFSLADVAQVLDIKEATAKTRVHRARLRLRDVLAEGLPKRALPPPAYSRQVCLDLLRTKLDCIDRGVPMPNADEIVCERCRAVFATLDLTADVCQRLTRETMPEPLRAALAQQFAGAAG